MSETSSPNRAAAIKEDGFVDFYELLGVEPDATLTRLRTTINALYNEAQSNRDHRNLNRRREYQTLLQLLPQAREMLLEDKKRALYDAFREDVKRGVTSMSFEDWSRNLQEEEETDKAGKSAVLGMQQEVRAQVQPAPPAKPVRPKTPSRVVVGDDLPADRPNRSSLLGSIITVAVFFLLFVVLRFGLKLDVSISILIACLAGIIAWFATHRKNASRTAT